MKNRNYLASVYRAFIGIILALKTEKNFLIHTLIALTFTIINILVNVETIWYAFELLTFGMVLVSELLNTAIEKTCNTITEEYNTLIKEAKDIAAGAVLMSGFLFFIIEGIAIWRALM